MDEIMTYEFDYCHFCAKDAFYYPDCKICLVSKYNNPPSQFVEKDNVKAYRKAMAKSNGTCWGCECAKVGGDE